MFASCASVHAAPPEKCGRALCAAGDRLIAEVVPLVLSRLQPPFDEIERRVLSVDYGSSPQEFKIHDLWMPLAAQVIMRAEGFDANVMAAVQVHDVGKAAALARRGAAQVMVEGAWWEGSLSRREHMEDSARLARTLLASVAGIDLERIVHIVARHDLPYCGQVFTDRQERLHRDIDRTFPVSCFSFYKDLLAQAESSRRPLDHLAPEALLLTRLAWYYGSVSELPCGWDSQRFPLNTRLLAGNDGGTLETPYGTASRSLIGKLFLSRSGEIMRSIPLDSPVAFEEFVFNATRDEFKRLISLAEGC